MTYSDIFKGILIAFAIPLVIHTLPILLDFIDELYYDWEHRRRMRRIHDDLEQEKTYE